MIKPGTYKHFKGGIYKILNIAKHSETMEELVIYQDTLDPKLIWARPLNNFQETITRDGKTFKRFKYMGDK